MTEGQDLSSELSFCNRIRLLQLPCSLSVPFSRLLFPHYSRYIFWSSTMSRDRDQGRTPPPWSGNQYQLNGTQLAVATDLDTSRPPQNNAQNYYQSRTAASSPASEFPRFPDRNNVPSRSSTLGSPDSDRNLSANLFTPRARSEDLNHTNLPNTMPSSFPGSSPRPSPAFLSSASNSSRPSTPTGSLKPKHPSSSGHSDDSITRAASSASNHSEGSTSSSPSKAPPTASSTSTSLAS